MAKKKEIQSVADTSSQETGSSSHAVFIFFTLFVKAFPGKLWRPGHSVRWLSLSM